MVTQQHYAVIVLDMYFFDKYLIPERTQRFMRFVLVGLLNTAFGYSVYAAFIVLGVTPQIALLMQFVIGAIWNFFTHARLVFDSRGYRRLPIYLACYALVYAINAILLKLALLAGLGPLVAQALILPITVVLSFVLISQALQGGAPKVREKT